MEDELIMKQVESNTLALNATAEVLQKFNSFLDTQISKEENEKEKEEEEEELEKAATDYQTLIKDVAGAVVSMLKEKNFGMEVDGKDTKKVGGEDGWPMGPRLAEEDKEKAVKLNTDTKDVQKPIQAAAAPGDEKKEDKKGTDEYPMEEDEKDEDEEEMKSFTPAIRKALKEAKTAVKELAELKKAIPNMIKEAADARLQKQGWREEKSTAPRTKSLGVETELPLKKSDEKSPDVVEELMKLSYRDLNRIQIAMQTGATDGLPEELTRLKS